MLRGVVSVSLRAPGEKGAGGGAAAVSSVNGRGDGTHKRAVPGSRAECREAQDPAQSPVHPSIRLSVASKARRPSRGLRCLLTPQGREEGAASCWGGTRSFWEEDRLLGQGVTGECPCRGLDKI